MMTTAIVPNPFPSGSEDNAQQKLELLARELYVTGVPWVECLDIAAKQLAPRVEWAYHPLDHGTKEPITKGWPRIQPGAFARTGCDGINIGGCSAGEYQVCVFDYDLKKDPEAGRQLRELIDLFPALESAPTVRTPSGGEHRYALAPADLRLKTKQRKFPAFDFLCGGKNGPGRNAVAPGSRTNAGEYKLIQPEIDFDSLPLSCFPLLPPEVIAALEEKCETAAPSAEVTSLSMERDFMRECEGEEPALKGSRGMSAYKMACRARDMGLPKEVAYQHMRDQWLPRWPEPITEGELYTQVERGYKYATGSAGSRTPEAKFTPDMAAPQELHVWGAPQELKLELLPVSAFTPEMLPDCFRFWLSDAAHRMQVPLDFVAAAAITTIGSVIGASCGIKPKRLDDWMVVPNLWGGVVAPPGQAKTPALSEVLRQLERLELQAKQEHDAQFIEYEADKRKQEQKRQAIDSLIKVAVKAEVKGEAPEQTVEALEQKLAEIPPLSEPSRRRYRTNDSTVEMLAVLLSQNPRGILVFRDEIIGLLKSWDRSDKETDRAFYLEGWNGTGSHIVDRIGRGTTHVPNMCISLLGGIQPEKLILFLHEAIRDGGNDGLVQRLQLLVYPDPVSWKFVDEYPDHSAKNHAFETIKLLANADFISYGAQVTPQERRPYFRFDDQAQLFFNDWLTTLETQKLKAPDEPILIEHLSKYRSLMPSLALIFHLADVASKHTGAGPVTFNSAVRAAQWCAYLESHARRIYALVTDISGKIAARLAEKIKRGAIKSPFTARDVYRKQWTLLSEPKQVTEACNDLIDAGWLRGLPAPPSSSGGRSSVMYEVNPAVFRAPPGEALSWEDVT